MKRDEIVSLLCFILLGILLLVGIYEALWSLSQLLELAPYFIITGMGAVLLWGFRERIEDAIRGRGCPELSVAETKIAAAEEVRELLVKFSSGGSRKHEVRFHYVTVSNSGRKTAEDLVASCRDVPIRMIPLIWKSTFAVDSHESVGSFHKNGIDSFIYALIGDQRKLRDTVDVHPGATQAWTFVLFFTLKGRNDCLYVPCNTKIWFHTRRGFLGIERDNGTGIIRLPLHLTWKDMEAPCDVLFEARLADWKSFEIKPVESSQ